MSIVQRTLVTPADIQRAYAKLGNALEYKLDKHGHGSYVTAHEAYGILIEEVQELLDEVKGNNPDGVIDELLDVVVAAFFSVASAAAHEREGVESSLRG